MSSSSEESPGPTPENVSKSVKITAKGSQSSRKNSGKVPKRIHKAEREKLKREHLNDLFLSLANVLELPAETNGKASILNEATRFVKDMLAQVKSLRGENATLLSESQYVDMETKELQDEKASLESQITELQNELKDRVGEAALDLNTAPQYLDDGSRFPAAELAMQQAHNLKSLYVIPLCSDPSVFQPPGNAATAVSKPQARYPNPADTWASQLLEKHQQ